MAGKNTCSKDNGGTCSSRLLSHEMNLRRIETNTNAQYSNIETDLEFLLRLRQPGLSLDHSDVAHWLRPKPAKMAPFYTGVDKLLCSSRLGVTCHPPPDAVGGALFDSPPNPSSSGPQPRPWDTDCTPDSAPHPAANRVGIRARIGGCYTPESGTDRQRKTALTVKNRVPESVPISGRPQPETQNKTSCNHEQKNWPVKREDQKQSQAN